MKRALANSYGKDTTEIFSKWETYLRELSEDNRSGMILGIENALAHHAKEQMKKRKITTGQMKYILKNEFELTRIQRSTRKNTFKLRVEGKDFDGIRIALIVIPGGIGYKIITVFSI